MTRARPDKINEPLHDIEGLGDLPWRENAFLIFWSAEDKVYGSVHVSTSPNDERGRRARCSLEVDGARLELIEPLDPGTFQSSSIHYDLARKQVSVFTDRVELRASMSPRFVALDYTADPALPSVQDKVFDHAQQGVDIAGTVTLDGKSTSFAGTGFRDRSWGFRDETSWGEYVGMMACFPDRDISLIKYQRPGAALSTGGGALSDSVVRVEDVAIGRDAAGLVSAMHLGFADGSTARLRRVRDHAGFWVPMGVDDNFGRAFSAFDQIVEWESDELGRGFAMIEQGCAREVS